MKYSVNYFLKEETEISKFLTAAEPAAVAYEAYCKAAGVNAVSYSVFDKQFQAYIAAHIQKRPNAEQNYKLIEHIVEDDGLIETVTSETVAIGNDEGELKSYCVDHYGEHVVVNAPVKTARYYTIEESFITIIGRYL